MTSIAASGLKRSAHRRLSTAEGWSGRERFKTAKLGMPTLTARHPGEGRDPATSTPREVLQALNSSLTNLRLLRAAGMTSIGAPGLKRSSSRRLNAEASVRVGRSKRVQSASPFRTVLPAEMILTPRLVLLALFVFFALCVLLVHLRGRVRLRFDRQLVDHSAIFAPYNLLMYAFSAVPAKPILDRRAFPQLDLLRRTGRSSATRRRTCSTRAISARRKKTTTPVSTAFSSRAGSAFT